MPLFLGEEVVVKDSLFFLVCALREGVFFQKTLGDFEVRALREEGFYWEFPVLMKVKMSKAFFLWDSRYCARKIVSRNSRY
ncbi:MAG: hypothetical protein MUC87_18520 [Bacteroidia bacterium]|jgi:hypothetical protein|nr:hypothetical protein [Bacteroidia bacterium]